MEGRETGGYCREREGKERMQCRRKEHNKGRRKVGKGTCKSSRRAHHILVAYIRKNNKEGKGRKEGCQGRKEGRITRKGGHQGRMPRTGGSMEGRIDRRKDGKK